MVRKFTPAKTEIHTKRDIVVPMDTNQIKLAIDGNIEQLLRAAYHEGLVDGRKEAAEELRLHFDKWNPVPERRSRAAPRSTTPAVKTVWLAPDEVAPLIKTALTALEADHPEGASPMLIAEHLKPNGQPVNVQAVRSALRQLTMQGEVRRVAHARYLPAAPPVVAAAPPVAEPQPEAAE
jgi:hypothetical protein